MIALLILAFPLLALGTWIMFLAVMMLKQRRDSLPKITQQFGYVVLYIGYAFDIVFNILASFLFLELPRDWLFTSRVSRHIKETGWRADLAKWFCSNLLDPFDHGHCG